MRAQFLKIAGVKSEAEFYKKFPSEDAFMKKHGKAVKKLMAKKAQVGTMIPNIQTPSKNPDIIRFGEEEMYDASAKLTGRKTYQELKDDAMYNAQMASYKSKGEEKNKPGLMDQLTGLVSQFSNMGGGTGDSGGDVTWLSDASEHSVTMPTNKSGGSTKKFQPHIMYNPKTGKGKKAKTLKEHLALKKKGWGHTPPKAQIGGDIFGDSADANFFSPEEEGNIISGDTGGIGDVVNSEDGGSNFSGILESIKTKGLPIISDIVSISDQLKAQKKAKKEAEQSRRVSDVALRASKTMPEEIEREYVRPEDFTNTGEEFFPVYGVGTNVLAKSGININPKNEGKFTAWAKKRGMSVAEAADKVMANKNKYSTEVVKMANFAKNARNFNKAQDGGMFTGEYMPLVDPNQQKQFKLGGILGSNSYLVPKALDGVSYGGGQEGSIGTNIAYMSGVEQDAGSRIGSKIGSTAGSIFGPPGALIGGYLGTAVGGILDKDGDAIRRHQRAEEKNLKEMAFNSMAPAIQANYASYVKNGGEIQSMRSGGNMRGNYVPPNPSALDTMAMGGDVKTLWGGKAETVSYNPYAGGESIEFKGNSHSYRDPKTGETGIGVAYGDNAVNNNEPSVEVENEPAQKLKQGGEEENLVVYGDMYIPDNLVPLIQDDKAKGKKFKNYVSNVLNPQESKVNKRQEKVADLGLESDDTAIGQLERNTADIVLKGSDMKLKSIAEKKNILAELQNVMNETFDQFEIDANKFIKKGEMVKDPMRVENTEMAKYGKRVIKAQTGITTDDFDTKQVPKTDMTEEELKSEGYVREGDSNIFIKRDGENVEAVESSGSSLGYTPEGQSANESGTYGNTTQKDVDAVLENNTWFKGGIDLSKDPVTYKGQFVNPDVLRFQQEFNERVKGTDIKPVKIDGRFGEETKTAMYTEPVEGKKAVEEKVMLEQPKTTVESTTVAPEQLSPMVNFQRPIDDIPLGTDQLLGEYYALATNQVQPVQAQSFQPRLRVPYDISLQDMRNDLTSQSRMLERNPALQNNPAALAMMQAPLYDARNKINAEEFRQNQVMKDSVYSGNLEAINKAKMINLGLYDQQADRQAQAVANTRSQNIDALQSIGNKRAQNIRDNAMMKTYANMYPSFRFDRNYQAQVQPTGYSPFNIPGQGNTLNPIGMASNISGNPNIANYLNLVNQLGQFTNKNKQATTEEETTEQGSGKYGKKVTRNNRNSNILRELRNL